MLERVPPLPTPRPPITAVEVPVAKKAEGGSQLENQKRKKKKKTKPKHGFTWQTICIFFGSAGREPLPGDFLLNVPWKREPLLEAVGPGQDPRPHSTSADPRTGQAVLACSRAYLAIIKNVFIIIPPDKTCLG